MVRGSNKRTRPWTDAERRTFDWNEKYSRPVKTMACAATYLAQVEKWPPKFERRGPDHEKCEGLSLGPCACNCHYEWKLDDLVRLPDGRVGRVRVQWNTTLTLDLGGDVIEKVDIGLPVLLAPGQLQGGD